MELLPAPEPSVEIVETEQRAECFRVDTMCLDYRLTEDQTAVLTDTFDFEVPANTRREVSFIYKRIRQHGLVRIDDAGEIREAPFRVAVRLEVDLAQNDRAK